MLVYFDLRFLVFFFCLVPPLLAFFDFAFVEDVLDVEVVLVVEDVEVVDAVVVFGSPAMTTDIPSLYPS